MAEIILNCTLKFLADKLRDKVAEKLGRGDAVDHDLRNLIVADIKEIKSKIDSLARKDLEACINTTAVAFENMLHLDQRKNREDEYYSAQRAWSMSIKRLEDAHSKATDAFSNDALDISDRIKAAHYRIWTTLLVTTDKPANAFTSCIMHP